MTGEKPANGERRASAVPTLPLGANVILCADDFGITEGVSRGIAELAKARRISATGAMVNMPAWRSEARTLTQLRPFVAAGVHLNLTLGTPLGKCPGLTANGTLIDHMKLVQRCLSGLVSTDEIAAEIDRQLATFEAATGFPPDFVDGHQHAHALPRVRTALVEVMAGRYGNRKPLVRDPADRPGVILSRQTSAPKALVIAALSRGFGEYVRTAGFPTNHGFAGVSPFKLDIAYADELSRFFQFRGSRHLVMCHPGYPDAALAELDPVVERRRHELVALFAAPRLDEAIWHVEPRADRSPVDWLRALPP